MTEQDYPKLPLPMRINLTDGMPGRAVVEYYTADQMRDYADADRAQQSARHREELLADEITIGNLQAQVASDDVYISEILTREKNAAIADRQNYEVRVRLEADLEQLKAANLRAQLEQAQPVWPVMPPSKGQSPVLFEDGYAEGWAKCLDACKAMLSAAPQAQPTSELSLKGLNNE